MAKLKLAAVVAITCGLMIGTGLAITPAVLKDVSFAADTGLKFEILDPGKYQSFVMNWDDQKYPALYAVIRSKAEWDKVFHPAPVMGGRQQFAPELKIFEKQVLLVVARVMPSPGDVDVFQVESAQAAAGNLVLKYKYQAPKPGSATFTVKHFLGVFVPKEDYATMTFIENGARLGVLDLKNGSWRVPSL
jgi:hypothetical protein